MRLDGKGMVSGEGGGSGAGRRVEGGREDWMIESTQYKALPGSRVLEEA